MADKSYFWNEKPATFIFVVYIAWSYQHGTLETLQNFFLIRIIFGSFVEFTCSSWTDQIYNFNKQTTLMHPSVFILDNHNTPSSIEKMFSAPF